MNNKSALTNLLAISRPKFYSYLFGPFIVGLAAATTTQQQLFSWDVLLLLFFFIFPANLFLYGVNDLFDHDTDQFNQKKRGPEHLLKRSEHSVLVYSLLAVVLFSAVIYFFVSPTVRFLLLIFMFLSTFYSAPPIRFKSRPILDAYSNVLYIFPGLIGYALLTGEMPSFSILIACWAWAVGMHAFSAIPDILPDAKAGITTTAVLMGEKAALCFVGVHWLVFSILITNMLGNWGVVTFIYPGLIIWLLINPQIAINKIYWWFPVVNTIIGFIGFWYFFLPVLL